MKEINYQKSLRAHLRPQEISINNYEEFIYFQYLFFDEK